MRFNQKNKKLIILILIVCISGVIKNFETSDDKTYIKEELKIVPKHSWFNNSMEPIYIDAGATGVGAKNWTWAASQLWCFGDGSWSNPYTLENMSIDAAGSDIGILIKNSRNVYFTIKNCTIKNVNNASIITYLDYAASIKLLNCSNGILVNNTCSNAGNQGCGILIYENSFNITIDSNQIISTGLHGILVDGGLNISILKNTVNFTGYQGIYFYLGCENSTIAYNYVQDANQLGMSGSNAGIRILDYNDNNEIYNNTIISSWRGIYLRYSDYNTIHNNNIINNFQAGLILSSSSSNDVFKNEVYNENGITNQEYGIWLASAHNNFINDNNVINNSVNGIYVQGSDNNSFTENFINENSANGIRLESGCLDNNFSKNIISNNNVGTSIQANSNGSIFQNNNFLSNTFQAIDDGYSNQWNSTIGNYWNDYAGFDNDDNGIGDSTYSVPGSAGSQDYLPVWDDGIAWSKGNPIFIDGSTEGPGLGQNWYWALSQGVCTGVGTELNPYLIKDFVIDATGSTTGSGIFIQNSEKHFIVQNCTLFNSGTATYDAGIRLSNVDNGNLIENNCSNNGRYGILLYGNCKNTILNNNTANSNNIHGIRVEDHCEDNLLVNNTCLNNLQYGISLYYFSNNNEIIGNNLSYNIRYGLELWDYCSNNVVHKNIISFNMRHALSVVGDCHNNTITSNEVFNNFWHGIYVWYYSNGNIIANNSVINNAVTGDYVGIVIWDHCNFNMISDNIAINNGTNNQAQGIKLDSDCHGNNIINNTVTDNNYDGIYLMYNCNDNKIIGNIASNKESTYQDRGIYLYFNCDGNLIENNTVNNNSYQGIGIYGQSGNPTSGSDGNIIRNNIVNNNSGHGIAIAYYGELNEIVNNECNLNKQTGIYLFYSSSNSIFDNFVMHNGGSSLVPTNSGIYLQLCTYNNLSGNTVGNELLDVQKRGIYLYDRCSNNTIQENYIINNYDKGILIELNCDANNITDNLILTNVLYGAFADVGCENNRFHLNNFTGNAINAYDNGTNIWNVGSIGNYWSDYPGVDLDDDGIGDIAYLIAGTSGAYDYYPIWDDGRDPPIIIVNYPLNGTVFGAIAPTINVTILDTNLGSSAFYNFTSMTGFIVFNPSNGINLLPTYQHLWDNVQEGNVIFYLKVIDKADNTAEITISIIKDLPDTPQPGPAIPFGGYYLFITGFSVIALIMIYWKKLKIVYLKN